MAGHVVCAVQTGGRRSETFLRNRSNVGRKERDSLFSRAGAWGWNLTKRLVKMSALPPPLDFYTKNNVAYTKESVVRGGRLNAFLRLRRGCPVCRFAPPSTIQMCVHIVKPLLSEFRNPYCVREGETAMLPLRSPRETSRFLTGFSLEPVTRSVVPFPLERRGRKERSGRSPGRSWLGAGQSFFAKAQGRGRVKSRAAQGRWRKRGWAVPCPGLRVLWTAGAYYTILQYGGGPLKRKIPAAYGQLGGVPRRTRRGPAFGKCAADAVASGRTEG